MQDEKFILVGVATIRKASGEETRTPLYIEAHRFYKIRTHTKNGLNRPFTVRKAADGENPGTPKQMRGDT